MLSDSNNSSSFINEKQIFDSLKRNTNATEVELDSILSKALLLKGLSLDETAALLNCRDIAFTEKLFTTARTIKEKIYGNRLVFFAPLYLSNECINNCLYCAFRKDNDKLERKTLSMNEIRNETIALESQGHKRLLLVAGEHPKSANVDYVTEAIRTVYATKNQKTNGEIRRVNINVAPLSVADFRKLKEAGIGTYQLFQETYHRETYKTMHPSGPKSDYDWRITVMDRAQEAGIDDVGIGALFGLFDYRFEVLALLQHSQHLEKVCGVGPHTISVPRIEPAFNVPFTCAPPAPVSDFDFKRIIAILRLAVPYTGIILSTRERADFRDEAFQLGISQISAGSRTDPGAYSKNSAMEKASAAQFSVGDHRSLAEVVRGISKNGFFPSFCTACYRLGRTGKDFMELAKPGFIQNYCTPNCILTFKEYLIDYCSNSEDRANGEKLIEAELKKIANETLKKEIMEKLKEIEKGKRDLYF